MTDDDVQRDIDRLNANLQPGSCFVYGPKDADVVSVPKESLQDDLGAEFDAAIAEPPIVARWCFSLESAIETTVRLLGEAGRDQQSRLDAHLERLLVLQLGYFTRCAEARP